MSIGIIILIVIAVIVVICISYAFRDAFFLFEGICFLCDCIGSLLGALGDGDGGGDGGFFDGGD